MAHHDGAAAGVAVADHVRGALACGEAEQRLHPCRQRPGALHPDLEPGGLERLTGGVELGVQAGATQAAHRRAGLLQGGARDRLDVAHVALRLNGDVR
jgi:hypothetical protein